MSGYKLKILLLLGFIVSTNFYCESPLPTNPPGNTQVSLNLNFKGKRISPAIPAKSSLPHQRGQFTQIQVRVYASGTPETELINEIPLITSQIDLLPGATEFSGELVIPAGSNRLFVVDLLEMGTELDDSSSILSYSGRKGGITIEFGKINEIDMELYPVPIKNKRVVLWSETIELGPVFSNQSLAIGIATLDSLRGIQFDLVFTPAYVRVAEIYPTELANHFSDVLYNNIPQAGTRLIFFDHQNAQVALPPIADPGAIPQPLIEAVIVPATENITSQQSILIALQNGVVNAMSARNLEVFAVPGKIDIQ